jgi:hypothetical protein
MSFVVDKIKFKGSKNVQKDGSLLLDGKISRCGVYEYARPDGSKFYRYRPSEEVFDPESLKSFAGTSLTLGHPIGTDVVDSMNRKDLSVGNLGTPKQFDDVWVTSEIRITEQKAIDAVLAGLDELSAGYFYQEDMLNPPQSFVDPIDGKSYVCDSIMRKIEGNHVALVTMPRAGPGARLSLDSKEIDVVIGRPVCMASDSLCTDKVIKRGEEWIVTNENGDKVLGTHSSKEDAEKQLRAIEASKAKNDSMSPEGRSQDEAKDHMIIPEDKKSVTEANVPNVVVAAQGTDTVIAVKDEAKDGADPEKLAEVEKIEKKEKHVIVLKSPGKDDEVLGEYETEDDARKEWDDPDDDDDDDEEEGDSKDSKSNDSILNEKIVVLENKIKTMVDSTELDSLVVDFEKARRIARSYGVSVDGKSAKQIRKDTLVKAFPGIPNEKLDTLTDSKIFDALVKPKVIEESTSKVVYVEDSHESRVAAAIAKAELKKTNKKGDN